MEHKIQYICQYLEETKISHQNETSVLGIQTELSNRIIFESPLKLVVYVRQLGQ